MFLVVQYQDQWLGSTFKKEIPFPENEASFVHLEAQIKCHLKHEVRPSAAVWPSEERCRTEYICATSYPVQTIFLFNLN